MRFSQIDSLNEIIRAWGLNPEEILTKEALTKSNATIIEREQLENSQIYQLRTSLRQQMLREIREEKNAERY